MIFKDRFEKMSRKDLEEEIRVYKDFSQVYSERTGEWIKNSSSRY